MFENYMRVVANTSRSSQIRLRTFTLGTMSDMEKPKVPVEAQLIEKARKALRPPLSIRAAAKAAGLSDTRWRQISAGYQTVSAGNHVPVKAPAETAAKMIEAIGGLRGPEDYELLREARPDVMEVLVELQALSRSRHPSVAGLLIRRSRENLIPSLKRSGVIESFSTPDLLAELGRRLSVMEIELLSIGHIPPHLERYLHEETQPEPQQSPRSSTSSGTSRAGAPNTRAAESAAYDPAQHAGVSGIAKEPPVAQDQFDLAASRTRKGYRTTQDERDKQDEWHPDPEGSEGGA